MSTNVGGFNVLRYGMTRDLVLGLKVVLADGRVWDGLGTLRKDNRGVDLKQIFIGSEGTLGIVTAAALTLFPRPSQVETALVGVGPVGDAIALYALARAERSDLLMAFELILRDGLEVALRLRDLDGVYADPTAFAASAARIGDRVVYRVHEVRPVATQGDLVFGTTFMAPGLVGNEFYGTRGRVHARANRSETYTGEAGQGLMLMESPGGETRIVEVAPRVTVYVPPLWIHRSVNTGAEPLVMSFCYPSDSGQDYEVIARSNGLATRVMADGRGGWRAVPNTAYRPRTRAEIDAILATQD